MIKAVNLLIISVMLGVSSIFSQSSLIELPITQFSQELSKKPELATNDIWESLILKARKKIDEHNYSNAQDYSNKAIIIAEKLNDDLRLARSYYQLGNSYQNTSTIQIKRISSYQKGLTLLSNIQKTLETRNLVGYIFNGISSIYLDPDYVRNKVDQYNSARGLYEVFKMIAKLDDPTLIDLEIMTSINISKFFYVEGHIPSQIVWLIKANELNRKVSGSENYYSNQLEILFNLQRAYRRIGDYQQAIELLGEINTLNKKKHNDFVKLEYYRQLESTYSDINDLPKQWKTLQEAINLSSKINYQKSDFITIKILNLLIENRFNEARVAFDQIKNDKTISLENIDKAAIQASLAAFENNEDLSNKYFSEADKILNENLENDWQNKIFLLHKKLRVSQFLKNFRQSLVIGEEYLKTAIDNNNKDSLPFVLIEMSKAEIGLGNFSKAQERIGEAINVIEEKRRSPSAVISVKLMELLYEAYQIQVTLYKIQNNTKDLLFSSEMLKSRWLNDRVLKNPLNSPKFKSDLSGLILEQSLKVLEDPSNISEIQKLKTIESEAIFFEKNNSSVEFTKKRFFESLDELEFEKKTAIITYNFTYENKLIALVYQSNKQLQSFELDLNKTEVDNLVEQTDKQIKNLRFFKQNSKDLFDKFLKPLKIEEDEQLIIIPDGSLWRLPFQAFSQDGNKYLIEDKLISYVPSITILLNQLQQGKPNRKSFQVFANSQYDKYLLKFADIEAKLLSSIYNVIPFSNATATIFKNYSDKSDILHFSMHAEIEPEAFNSYLAFQPDNEFKDGKLRVNDLLNIKLKEQSLVFLASCSTNNIFNSEGLVSISWGMFAAGASSVVSAQWEANDESTSHFSKSFYSNYRAGKSAGESLRQAAIEMINSSNDKFNKPYFWAEFTLSGDFR